MSGSSPTIPSETEAPAEPAGRRSGPKRTAGPPRSPAVRRLRAAGAVFAAAAILAVAAVGLLAVTTPDPRPLATRNPRTTAWIERIRAAGGEVLWIPVPLDRISPHLRLAVLVGEDVRFFSHHGFDWIEVRAAFRDAVTRGRLRGASTLTQQLARNLWLSRRRTVSRKLREAVLAWKLERTLSKRRILELYLDTAPFGPDTVGAEAAALRYYGVHAADLTPDQAARLAAALPAPLKWYPGSDTPRVRRHFQRIRRRMARFRGLQRLP